jgi:pyrroline-5-carboxylate reductase
MGEAILSRLIQANCYDPIAICVSEPSSQRRSELRDRYGISIVDDNGLALEAAEAVILAIKPQSLSTVVQDLQGRKLGSSLLISILAGTTIQSLEAAFPNRPIIRTMPNTPALVGAGMTAISCSTCCTPHHQALAMRLFQSIGDVVEVPESQMDAVTALSGSGPGYIAVLIEALTDGGVAVGLPRAIAAQLAVSTVKGTTELLKAQNLHPAELKDRVTSPGGTTIAGIAKLEQAGFRSAIIEAIRAAHQRSQEIGK